MLTKILPYYHVSVTGGFWKEKQELIRGVTMANVYKRFSETGRFEAFKQNWQEGMPNRPHIFWDSDVAKWLESAAYLTKLKREPELEAIVDEVVSDIEKNRREDGYYNSYFQHLDAEKIFKIREWHELYCAGHLIEAAIAYDDATGKHRFLELMLDYAALIKRVFMDEGSAAFSSPGHEEIELALVKLADYTGDEQWLELAKFFLEKRGCDNAVEEFERYRRQDFAPVREQFTAEGHAVRACYLYSAMADVALRCGDEGLKKACDKLFESITRTKMYITGGVGSTSNCEVFEDEFRLPNDTAYAETCAALSLALFARRMSCMEVDSRYADTVERVIYNAFLSGLSLDGKSFFYENAQEIDLENRQIVRAAIHPNKRMHFPITERVEVFSCSCCPPNVTRFISSIGDFVFSSSEDTLFVNQFMNSEGDFGDAKLTVTTNYPYEGVIAVKLEGAAKKVAVRIPGWCKAWTLKKNGARVASELLNGYAVVECAAGDELTLELELAIRRVRADHRVRADRGMSAVTWGPFVMCLEGVDNGGRLGNVRLVGTTYEKGFDSELGVPCLYTDAVRETVNGLYSDEITAEPFRAKLIPYFTFANRGETDMRIWL